MKRGSRPSLYRGRCSALLRILPSWQEFPNLSIHAGIRRFAAQKADNKDYSKFQMRIEDIGKQIGVTEVRL